MGIVLFYTLASKIVSVGVYGMRAVLNRVICVGLLVWFGLVWFVGSWYSIRALGGILDPARFARTQYLFQ